VASNVEVVNDSHANGGHQNGQDEGSHQNGQVESVHSNGEVEGDYQNGHNGNERNGHPVEPEANGHNIEDELDLLYQDYGYGASVELESQPKSAELTEAEVTPNAEMHVEIPLEERADEVPDGGDQNQKTEEPQQNRVQEYETEDEPMELKVSEGAEEDLDSEDKKVACFVINLCASYEFIQSSSKLRLLISISRLRLLLRTLPGTIRSLKLLNCVVMRSKSTLSIWLARF
jgi:hypothetical protein